MRKMAVKKSDKLLLCKEEIKDYLGNITDYMFRKYIKMGMPALFDGREWIAHTENLEEWFRSITRIQIKEGIDNILEENEQ